MAGHYGSDETFYQIAKRYYWVGMRKDKTDYERSCPECCHYKTSNQKPSGLLQTTAYTQCFKPCQLTFLAPFLKHHLEKMDFYSAGLHYKVDRAI